jgi:DNA-binding GntR family transcriptional regulator
MPVITTATEEGRMPDSTDQDQQAELAYSALKRGIMEFRFAPGERLSPTALRERLGVGRTPVREAIVRLRQEGLVVTRPKSGSYVALVDLDAAECARFLRSNTERAVVVECCSRAGEEGVTSLRKLLGEQKRAMEAHDQRSFFNADNRMHEELYCIAGRQRAWAWLEETNLDLERYRWLHIQARGMGWGSILVEHQELVDAIARKDPEEASYVAVHHLHVMLDERNEVVAAFPGYFVQGPH